MKAFLMCGGKGERLKKLTKNTPKCMLPINGEIMLARWLRKFSEWNFSEIFVNANMVSNGIKIIDYVTEDLSPWNVTFSMEYGPKGTVPTLLHREPQLRGEIFAIVYSDVWTTFDLRKMMAYHKSCPKALATIGVYIPEIYEGKGIVTIKDSIATKFEERPKKIQSPFIWAGIMVASPEIFSFIKRNDMKDIATDLLPVLTKTGRVHAFHIEEPLWDMGASPERYREVNKKVKRFIGGRL